MSTENSGSGLRKALGTVARGFLFGIGFCIALAGTYFIAWQVTMKRTEAAMGDVRYEAMGEIRDPGQVAAKDITVSNVEELKHDGLTSIIGSVKNSGKTPARGITIQADFFQHGKFVDQYSTYILGNIAPGESKNFKISCGCKDSPPAEHDSYKVEIQGGY